MAPSRRLRRFYGVDPAMHAFPLSTLIQFRSNSHARCAPTHAVQCLHSLQAHKNMHISESVQLLVVRGHWNRAAAAAISARAKCPKKTRYGGAELGCMVSQEDYEKP